MATLLVATPTISGAATTSTATTTGDGQRIVISLEDRRLYLLEPGRPARSFPVAIGRPGVSIPLGDTTVVRKRRDPTWRPTASEKRDDPTLPDAVPPGPSNPLGKFALNLGWPAIAIHGTNRPSSVGRRASAGCFRMLPDDIATVFAAAEVGTPVRVVTASFRPEPAPRIARAATPAPVPTPSHAAPAAPAVIAVRAEPPVPIVPDPRCAVATAPLRRLVCATPELAALDGRARGMQERFLATLSDMPRREAAYALIEDERRFDDRVALSCWIRRGADADPAVAAAARACLKDALTSRLSEVERRVAAMKTEMGRISEASAERP